VIVRTPGDDRVIARMRAELGVSAWNVVEIRPDDRHEKVPLATWARTQAATAAIRVDEASGEIELFIARAGTSDGTSETLASPGGGGDDRVLALRATEALRARGLNLDRPRDRAEPGALDLHRAAETPAPERPAANGHDEPPSERRLWIETAAAGLASPGGVGPSMGGWAALRVDLGRLASLSLLGLVPLTQPRVDGAEGTARIRTFLIGAAVDLRMTRPSWEVRGGAGLARSVTAMTGDTAQAGYGNFDDTAASFSPFARSSLHVAISERLYACAGMMVGVTAPRVVIRFGDRDAATWGRPWVLGTLGLELLVFGSRP
jgi:hypothetical protein